MSEADPDTARPKREIKTSRRAQDSLDSGFAIPGISELPAPATITQEQSAASSSRMVQPKPKAAPPAKSAPQNSKTSPRPTHQGISIPPFGPDTFFIYNWQIPIPSDFLNLADQRKAWKQRVDELEKANDIDDGADDWHDFCGNREFYPDGRFEYVVASTFKIRAKRAFWAGKPWLQFHLEERSIDSEAIAKAEPDPKRKSIMMEDALDNKLRMHIFDALKHRLCEEIWLEEYKDPPGLVQLTLPRRNSAAYQERQAVQQLRREHRRMATTGAEASRGIAYWSVDGFGTAQPVYDDEAGIPSGITDMMRDMLLQEYTDTLRAPVNRQQMPQGGNLQAPGGLDAGRSRPGIGLPPMPNAPMPDANQSTSAETSKRTVNGGVQFERPMNFSNSEGGDA